MYTIEGCCGDLLTLSLALGDLYDCGGVLELGSDVLVFDHLLHRLHVLIHLHLHLYLLMMLDLDRL